MKVERPLAKSKRASKGDLSAELTEGTKALAQAREGKRALRAHTAWTLAADLVPEQGAVGIESSQVRKLARKAIRATRAR